ncbi:hypothetical protein L873DRAFT_1383254 [Choiromyces venosus 120613-1]|uniref:Transmembrane protein n=1 Tax=Choiromyces venosus 120613-1 TaxID=1336337 RepID=A0A3N4J9T3_9PEZI|nr:hypothetical protein L873DRAFT_1383254 [Choiromyces venosus 120613-1]
MSCLVFPVCAWRSGIIVFFSPSSPFLSLDQKKLFLISFPWGCIWYRFFFILLLYLFITVFLLIPLMFSLSFNFSLTREVIMAEVVERLGGGVLITFMCGELNNNGRWVIVCASVRLQAGWGGMGWIDACYLMLAFFPSIFLFSPPASGALLELVGWWWSG